MQLHIINGMPRDWFNEPDETVLECTERIDTLLDLKIKELRGDKGMTVAEISRCCGASEEVIRRNLVSGLEKLTDLINFDDLTVKQTFL